MILFEERKYFINKLVLSMLLVLLGVVLAGVYQQVVNDIPFGAQPLSDTALVVVSLMPFTLLLMMFLISMKVRMDETGLFFRIIPFQRRYHVYYWEEVACVCLKHYDGSSEIKVPFGSNTKGCKGLQLVLKDGNKIFFSSTKTEELAQVLKQLSVKGIVRTEAEAEEK
ncbi:hypothetical protein RCC89_16705 [Cytophagaceae bacterium ABcell3]|nr:hypothetical protein RCC89_16705 [Cytophagaceae bacterium ABcell3]